MPRLMVTSIAWLANDFPLYGARIFQSSFFAALYPTVSALSLDSFPSLRWLCVHVWACGSCAPLSNPPPIDTAACIRAQPNP
jgi:hypothetical protein